MFKLETMIYASEDGTSSVFTLNPALQKQLDALSLIHILDLAQALERIRQLQDMLCQISARHRLAAQVSSWHGTVSYTHLDVYKRQMSSAPTKSLQNGVNDSKQRRSVPAWKRSFFVLL